MIKDVQKNLQIIQQSLAINEQFGSQLNTKRLKDYRRQLRKIQFALEENCSVAVYGQSQTGKSHVINSLLSKSSVPFMIESDNKKYSFRFDINCSGDRTNEVESTGLITRFTRSKGNLPNGKVRVRTLSIADIVLILTDSYFNDIKADKDPLTTEEINTKLEGYKIKWSQSQHNQNYITEDDISDIIDYLKREFKQKAALLLTSNFAKDVSQSIEKMDENDWSNAFSLLWNENEQITKLFRLLIECYRKVHYRDELFIPFDAVLSQKGTILDIRWLDHIITGGVINSNQECEEFTTIFDGDGQMICEKYRKSELAAIIAEVTFYLPEEIEKDRPFLKDMDLLDFPGARSRKSAEENVVGDDVIPLILRRGKVAYLFNKYSVTSRISAILFCHYQNQTNESSVANSISDWIKKYIGRTPEERTIYMKKNDNVLPLLFVATKFNMDLKKTLKESPDNLSDHWDRFNTVYPEMMSDTKWYEDFSIEDGAHVAFRNIFPHRDFLYSREMELFDGFIEGETDEQSSKEQKEHDPIYMAALKKSFLNNEEVKKHFKDPQKTWNEVATVDNDGSKPIIEALSVIAPKSSSVRKDNFSETLLAAKKFILDELKRRYVSEDVDEQHKKLKTIIRSLRLTLPLRVSKCPESFGMVVDKLMIPASLLRSEAFDIYICHKIRPQDLSNGRALRMRVGIDLNADHDENLNKLKNYFLVDTEEELSEVLQSNELTIDEVLAPQESLRSSETGVVVEQLIKVWFDYLNSKTNELSELTDNPDEIIKMIQDLFTSLNVKYVLFKQISEYERSFIDKDFLPVPVADLASTRFNSFVSTVGKDYYTDEAIGKVQQISEDTKIPLQSISEVNDDNLRFNSIEEALENLPQTDDENQLQRQPFWRHFSQWENRLEKGLMFTSDVQHCNVELNNILEALIGQTKLLYC